MISIKKAGLTLIGGALVIALVAGVVALVSTSIASAQTDEPEPDSQTPELFSDKGFGRRGFPPEGLLPGGYEHSGKLGHHGVGASQDIYLAEALGITVEELQTAYEAASQAAIDQAVEDGIITQEQADAVKEHGGWFFGKGHMVGGFHGGSVDFDAFLSEALGVTVEELQAAREEASGLALEAAIEDGYLTEEQAELMKAHQALVDYLDKDAMMADALGITVDELKTAFDEGKRMPDLLDESGMTQEEFQAALQAAHDAAVQQAVEDGVITQEQADQILSAEKDFGHGGLPGFGGGMGKRGGHGGRGCPPDNSETDTPEGEVDA